MNIEVVKPISREEWLKALHVKGEADQQLAVQMDEAERLLLEAAAPKAIYRVMERTDVRLEGFSIEKHLEGCHKVAVMALTLGVGIDSLIRKIQVTDMAMAVMLDSGASILVEQLCDQYEAYIRENTKGYMTSRFSPGYGDYPLEAQKDIISCVDGQRKIGLNVTANSLMIPRKSVTALMGIADHPVTGRLATCAECVLRDKCTLRKEGKFCGN